MKKIVIIFALVSVITSLMSCNQDQLLDVENRNSLSAENFWQNQRDAESGIYSVYSGLQFDGVLGASATVNMALMSEAGRIGNEGDSAETIQIDDAVINSANNRIFNMWEDLYRIVFRANQVILNVPGITMDETAKKEIIGEAHFMRGLALFWIATSFNEGNVPMPLKPATTLEETRLSVTPRATVIEQILFDLKLAQTNLKDRLNWVDEGLQGRATWGAATSILGKVYLYEENFANAREEFLKVIESGEYELATNIIDNFNEEGEFNSESIFEVQFFENRPNIGIFGDGEDTNPTNEATLRPRAWNRALGGFSNVFATHFISSLYRNEVVDPGLPINTLVSVYDDESELIEEVARTISVRSQASIVYEDDGTLFYGVSTKEAFVRVLSRAQIVKNVSWLENSQSDASGINERIIRLADVFLMYAEALLRDQGDAGIAEALPYINMVRQRSGLVTLEKLFEGVDIPPVVKNTYPDLTNEEIENFVTNFDILDADDQAFLFELQPQINAVYNNIAGDAEKMQYLTEVIKPAYTIPESLRIPVQALTADNIIKHLFDKERPAEFAWEGRGILWQDIKRRPDGGVRRIQELGEVNYASVTYEHTAFEVLNAENVESTFQDFKLRKVNFTEADFTHSIPSKELIQNPELGSGN